MTITVYEIEILLTYNYDKLDSCIGEGYMHVVVTKDSQIFATFDYTAERKICLHDIWVIL
jgi:hypothetical protein